MNYRTLPPGYRPAGYLDFMRNRAQIKKVVQLSIGLIVVPLLIGLAVVPLHRGWQWMHTHRYVWILLAAALVLYIPLHELLHGLVMFLLSGVPAKYGLKLPYAYAGSTVWFDRRSHILTALAPVVLCGTGLMIAAILAPSIWFWPIWAVQISNLSGSAGDIYVVWALMRMDGDLLIQDTGVHMRVMKKKQIEDRNP